MTGSRLSGFRARLAIGIDLGGTNLRGALIDEGGYIHARETHPTDIAAGRDDFLQRLGVLISTLRSRAAAAGTEVTAIGIGVPGLISSSGVVLSSVNLRPLDGFDLRRYLLESTGVAVRVANDANAWGWGEARFGAGRGFRSFLVVTIGTGVGSGLVLDGKLWSGAGGLAAEFGHVTVEPQGRPCPCGNRGCLEQYVAAPALVRSARELVTTEALPYAAGDTTAEILAKDARGGDRHAAELFASAGRYLGQAVAAAVNLLQLEAVVIGGGVGASLDLFREELEEELVARSFVARRSRVAVVPAGEPENAGLLGAADLALRGDEGSGRDREDHS